jgi:hypothetical protein
MMPLEDLSTNEKGGFFFGSVVTNKNTLHKEIEISFGFKWASDLGDDVHQPFFSGFEGQQLGWWWWW